MNKITKLVIGVFALSFAAMTACKKSSSSSSSGSANLIGTWKFDKHYNDNNNNKVMDANELDTSKSTITQTIKFNSDGTAIETFAGIQLPIKWELLANDTYLDITDTTSTPADTYLHIESLTSTNLEVKDTTDQANGGTNWTYLIKQ